eukprot:s1341_g10.t1
MQFHDVRSGRMSSCLVNFGFAGFALRKSLAPKAPTEGICCPSPAFALRLPELSERVTMPPVDEDDLVMWKAVAFRGAVDKGDSEEVNEMLEAGCNPNYKMPDGSNWTVLMIAANAGHDELVQKFSKGGKGVSDKDSSGFQAMMLAALKGHTSVCRCLLDKKADPNANNEFGETPLMMAAAMGHKDVVSMLLDSGADANARDANEMSAVKKASRWGHVECLRTASRAVQRRS